MTAKRRVLWSSVGFLLLAVVVAACAGSSAQQQTDRVAPQTPGEEETSAPTEPSTPRPGPTATAEPQEVEPTPVADATPIADLIAIGAIEVRAQGESIERMELEIQNLVEEALDILIPSGTYFVSHSGSVQDMVVRKTAVHHLDPGELLEVLLDVACASMERDVPGGDVSFTLQRVPDNRALGQLMPALERTDVEYDVEQAAVWIVTDNADYGDLGRLGSRAGQRVIDADETVKAMQIVDGLGVDIAHTSIWFDREGFAEMAEDPTLTEWLQAREQRASLRPAPGTLTERGDGMGEASGFALSPDGSLIAASTEGGITLWDVASGDMLYSFMDSSNHSDLDFSPDGTRLASVFLTGEDSEIWLWQVDTGRRLTVMRMDQGLILDLAYAPGGETLAVVACLRQGSSSCDRMELSLWNTAVGARSRNIADLASATLAFTANGGELAAPVCPDQACQDLEIRFWDVVTGEVTRRLNPGVGYVAGMAIQGQRLSLLGVAHNEQGDFDQVLRVWELEPGAQVGERRLPPGTFWCSNLAAAPGEEVAVAAICEWGKGAQVALWQLPEAAKGDVISDIPHFATLSYHGGGRVSTLYGFELGFTPEGKTVAGLGRHLGQLALWDRP